MKISGVLLALSLVVLPGCRKSEVSGKAGAVVTETGATTTVTASDEAPVTSSRASVIKDRSAIRFVAAKVTRDHKGQFRSFDGWIEYAHGKPVNVSFDIDLSSVETDTPRLTEHLKSADFFDVAKYPKATFRSSSLTEAPGANGATHLLRGTLDLHGVQKNVAIPVKAETTAEGVRTTSEFTINRHDWGISYRGAADDLIKDSVLIRLDLLFPPPPAV